MERKIKYQRNLEVNSKKLQNFSIDFYKEYKNKYWEIVETELKKAGYTPETLKNCKCEKFVREVEDGRVDLFVVDDKPLFTIHTITDVFRAKYGEYDYDL